MSASSGAPPVGATSQERPQDQRDERRVRIIRWTSISLFVVAALSAALTSFLEDPARLPDVALGSTLILGLERFAATFAILFGGFVLLAYAWEGVLPTKVDTSGTEFPDVLQTDTIQQMREVYGQRLDQLEAAVFPAQSAGLDSTVQDAGVSTPYSPGKEVS